MDAPAYHSHTSDVLNCWYLSCLLVLDGRLNLECLEQARLELLDCRGMEGQGNVFIAEGIVRGR